MLASQKPRVTFRVLIFQSLYLLYLLAIFNFYILIIITNICFKALFCLIFKFFIFPFFNPFLLVFRQNQYDKAYVISLTFAKPLSLLIVRISSHQNDHFDHLVFYTLTFPYLFPCCFIVSIFIVFHLQNIFFIDCCCSYYPPSLPVLLFKKGSDHPHEWSEPFDFYFYSKFQIQSSLFW